MMQTLLDPTTLFAASRSDCLRRWRCLWSSRRGTPRSAELLHSIAKLQPCHSLAGAVGHKYINTRRYLRFISCPQCSLLSKLLYLRYKDLPGLHTFATTLLLTCPLPTTMESTWTRFRRSRRSFLRGAFDHTARRVTPERLLCWGPHWQVLTDFTRTSVAFPL